MSEENKPNAPYRVLARKYRPQNFDELIGQDALVRTLKNAIESGRIAHAFMLTGVRGVGKTTTARIIAKALNYTGADGKAEATTGPTDDCALCQAIAEDRHPDVIEMDAATRTGVDDIREILDGVRYAPNEARYKIYIIDEVHMLSRQAFNALLKTLEEPPEHVKFIFATTEIRKVPITVLSRCQRFDLRRVDGETLEGHFQNICGQEQVEAEGEALSIIARAADGSVRDGLSLLDQAMALSDKITAVQVQDMLGLTDRARTMDLLDRALTGAMPEALQIMDELYSAGADPVVLIQDLLDLTHMLTRLRAVPEAKEMKYSMAPDQVKQASDLASQLSMPTLGKTWQILLKGLPEVQNAPAPQNAAEMVLIRLAYAADLPDPGDLIKRLKDEPEQSSAPTSTPPTTPAPQNDPAPVAVKTASGGGQVMSEPVPVSTPRTTTALSTLEDVVSLLEENGEPLLASQIFQYAHLVALEEGRIELRPQELAPQKLTQDLGSALKMITGNRWMVSVSSAPGQPSLAEKAQAVKLAEYEEVLAHPSVHDVLQIFPGAELVDIEHINKEGP